MYTSFKNKITRYFTSSERLLYVHVSLFLVKGWLKITRKKKFDLNKTILRTTVYIIFVTSEGIIFEKKTKKTLFNVSFVMISEWLITKS